MIEELGIALAVFASVAAGCRAANAKAEGNREAEDRFHLKTIVSVLALMLIFPFFGVIPLYAFPIVLAVLIFIGSLLVEWFLKHRSKHHG